MKICMLLPFAVFGTYGGMQSHVYFLSEQMATMGHDVTVIGENLEDERHETINGVKRIGIKTNPSAYTNYFMNSYALTKISKRIQQIDRRENFDVLHAHGAGGVLMALKTRSKKNRLILTSHSLPPSYLTKKYSTPSFKGSFKRILVESTAQQIGKYLYRQADRNIAVSKPVANQIHQIYGVSWSRISVIPNGINQKDFFRNPSLKNQLVGNVDPLILFVGMWDRDALAIAGKGLHYLIEAFAKVRKVIPNAKLVVVGGYNRESSYAQRIFTLCKKLNVDSSIIFTGRLSPDQIKNYYASADVFVSSSLWEGFGLTVLEAMASGLPVVASKGPYLPNSEIISDKVSGLLYEAGNVNQLSEAIIRVLTSKELAEKLGANAKASVKTSFDWRLVAEKTLKLYY